MNNNKVTIEVKGKVGSGKSTITSVIKNALQDVLDNVEFDGGMDFKDESDFDKHFRPNINERCESLNDKDTVVEIKEIQLQRTAQL